MSRTGTVYHFLAASTKPAAATYKRTNRQTAQAAGRGRWEAKQGREAGPQTDPGRHKKTLLPFPPPTAYGGDDGQKVIFFHLASSSFVNEISLIIQVGT